MVDERKTARRRFAAALAVYLLWVAALVTMAVFSSTRPTPRKPTVPAAHTADRAVLETASVPHASLTKLTAGR
jgi:hypothetical protein